MMTTVPPLGLYVHIPFCPQRCPYCDFAVVTGKDHLRERYVDALCAEIKQSWSNSVPRPLDTIFIGGGTPSQLEVGQLDRLLSTVALTFGIRDGAEITIEANPGESDRRGYADFRRIGVNRISIGAQSLCDASLRRLGRLHTVSDVLLAFECATNGGFSNINLDLIYSIPGVPEADWRASLQSAIDLQPQHVSAYGLTIEEGTPFDIRVREGRMHTLPDDEDARQYRIVTEVLNSSGFIQYEVSNFARPGCRSRHNWGYWTGGEYFGVGLSAHSFSAGVRAWNLKSLTDYLAQMESGQSPRVGEEQIDSATARREAIWLGLRTSDGVEISEPERLALLEHSRFHALSRDSFIRMVGHRLKLTPAGLPVADALGTEIVTILEKDWSESDVGTRDHSGLRWRMKLEQREGI